MRPGSYLYTGLECSDKIFSQMTILEPFSKREFGSYRQLQDKPIICKACGGFFIPTGEINSDRSGLYCYICWSGETYQMPTKPNYTSAENCKLLIDDYVDSNYSESDHH